MNSNLNSDFSLNNTLVSDKLNYIMDYKKNKMMMEKINNILNKYVKNNKKNKTRKYIKEKLEVNNSFQYGQKKERKENIHKDKNE